MCVLTCDHEQFVELFENLDLEDGGQARDVSQRVLDHIQSVQTLFRTHHYNLKREIHKVTRSPILTFTQCIKQLHGIICRAD